MRKFLDIFTRIAIVSAVIILLGVTALLGLLWYFSRPLSDSQILKEQFEPKFPGYSTIKVLERKGERTVSNPRVLIIEVVVESYSGPVTCQGEVGYFKGDPSNQWLRWYDWNCIGHWMVIEDARSALFWDEGQALALCDTRIEDAALVLRWWVENGWVEVDQIRHPGIRTRVVYLLENNVPVTKKPSALFDTSQANVYDLVPELSEDKKVPTYVLRCDGTLDLILRGGPVWWEQPLDLQSGDRVIPLPAQRPATIQP
ncbi:MAG: hypothetical protein ACP5HM_07290 [Anaerolineae bacterium]